MLNVLPRQTWGRDEASWEETDARISAFAGRVKASASAKEATLAANNDAEQREFSGDKTTSTDSVLGTARDSGVEEASLVLPMTMAAPSSSLIAIQEWEGYVTGVGPQNFEAELVDVTGGRRHETEKAEWTCLALVERH